MRRLAASNARPCMRHHPVPGAAHGLYSSEEWGAAAQGHAAAAGEPLCALQGRPWRGPGCAGGAVLPGVPRQQHPGDPLSGAVHTLEAVSAASPSGLLLHKHGMHGMQH
jgi:hypothetical protein